MKILFAGTRWESCKALCIMAKNYGISIDIATFKNTYIEKNISSLEEYNKKIILEKPKLLALKNLFIILNKHKYDVFFSVGFPYILWKEFFRLNMLFINSHPHLLPRHKGYSVIAESFYRKESKYGVTIHKMIEQVDSGKIIRMREITINPKNLQDIYSIIFNFIEPSVIIESFPLILKLSRKSNERNKC